VRRSDTTRVRLAAIGARDAFTPDPGGRVVAGRIRVLSENSTKVLSEDITNV